MAGQFKRPLPRSRMWTAALDALAMGRMKRLAARHLDEGRAQLAIFAFDDVGLGLQTRGIYERDHLETLLAWLRAGPFADRLSLTAVDCGANIGNHTVFFAEAFSRVVGFEPNPATFRLLEANTVGRESVSIHRCGLSDVSGTAALYMDRVNVGGASLAPTSGSALDRVEIDLRPLDDFAGEIGTVGLIKFDVEGHELAAIEGGAEVIGRDRPVIVFEQHAGEIENGASPVASRLREMGYDRIYSVEKAPRVAQSRMLSWALRLIGGQYFTLREVQRFEKRYYQMLVAVQGP